VASVFGYTTEYILDHSLAWFVWAARAAVKERGDFIAAFFGAPGRAAEETEENLTTMGIKYERE